MMFFKTAIFASVVASVAAHATFQELWINGVDQGSWCVRLPQSNSPVTDVTSDVRLWEGKEDTISRDAHSFLSLGPGV